MTESVVRPTPARRPQARRVGGQLSALLGTTNPKDIAQLYLVTAFGYVMAAGLMATGADRRWASGVTLVYAPIAEHLVARSPVPLAGRTVLDLST